MTDETSGARGAAAWQEQRAAIAKRNADTRKRGQAERKSRDRAVEVRERAQVAREAQELEVLNAWLTKRRTESPGA
jgi:hypothetical protein